MKKKNVLLVEPYYAGSHKQLMDLINEELKISTFPSDQTHDESDGVNFDVHLATMTGKKWHWRARTSPLYFSQNIPRENFDVIFASCVLPLHELIALRPELSKSKKIIYFHENQLTYPVRKSKDRDFQYGYNQILSCIVADIILFNSKYNLESFLSNIKKFFKLQPDYRPKDLREQIEPKCRVFYFPMCFDRIDLLKCTGDERNETDPVNILWPHRWEFDKNPALFFRIIYRLIDEGVTNFRLSILGENFQDNPAEFTEAKSKLEPYIDHFGFLLEKKDYFKVLGNCDIVISCADHEFFGVAMLEAVYCGCVCLCPNKLVYPEIFPFPSCLYNSEDELYSTLKSFISSDTKTRKKLKENIQIDYSKYDWSKLKSQFLSILAE